MFVYGEYDDSPGGQLIGLVAVVIGIIGLIKSKKKILTKLIYGKIQINYCNKPFYHQR